MPYFTRNSFIQLLKQLNFHPNKEKGQCFLIDNKVCRKMVDLLNLENKLNRILEIGPGFGAFSDYIAENITEFYLIEQDPICTKFLEQNFRKKYTTFWLESRNISYLGNIPQKKGITIIQADILSIPWPKCDYIIGNLPFSITYPFIIKMVENWEYKSGVLILQSDLMKILQASSGKPGYGVLSVLFQLFFRISEVVFLESSSFYPVPDVKSVILQIQPKATLSSNSPEFISSKMRKEFIFFIEALFRMKTKLFRNILSALRKNISFMEKFSNIERVISNRVLDETPVRLLDSAVLYDIFLETWCISKV